MDSTNNLYSTENIVTQSPQKNQSNSNNTKREIIDCIVNTESFAMIVVVTKIIHTKRYNLLKMQSLILVCTLRII